MRLFYIHRLWPLCYLSVFEWGQMDAFWQHLWKTYERIFIRFMEQVRHDTENKCYNSGDASLFRSRFFSLSVQEHKPTIIPYCKNNSMKLKFSVQLLRCSLNTLVKSGKMPKKYPRRLPSLLVCWCCYLTILLITLLVKIDYYCNHKWIS